MTTAKAKKWKWAKVAKGHRMQEQGTTIMAPAGTPRFYGVRGCVRCGAKQYEHPAGKFMDDELQSECVGSGGTPK